MMRGFIVYTHLAIEDLLRALLFDFLKSQNRSLRRRDAIRAVDDMRSTELIQWCGRLRLITTKQYRELIELNRVRNICAHNWVLDLPQVKRVMAKSGKRRIRVPRVIFHGKNLLVPGVFSGEFCVIYGGIYIKRLLRVWKMQGKL